MKQSVETLQAMGYTGYIKNKHSGHIFEARFPLDDIAWCMNNRPQRVRYTNDDRNGKVRVHLVEEQWVPEKPYEAYAERAMREDELYQAILRLNAAANPCSACSDRESCDDYAHGYVFGPCLMKVGKK